MKFDTHGSGRWKRVVAGALAGLAVAWAVGPMHVSGQEQRLTREELGRQSMAAVALYKQGKLAEAAAEFERLLPETEVEFGKNHDMVLQMLRNIGELHEAAREYDKAVSAYLRRLQRPEDKLGKDYVEVANALNKIGSRYHEMGMYAKAALLHERALRVHEAKLGEDHLLVADSINYLVRTYHALGKYGKEEQLRQRSLRIREARLGKNHLLVSQSLNNLAAYYADVGDYTKAEPLYLRSLGIRESSLGKDHVDVALVLNNLGSLYGNMKQHAKAESLYQRSLRIHEAALGKEHLAVARLLHNLGVLYDDMGEQAKAEPLHLRSLRIREAQLGKNHPDVAQSLKNLAGMYSNMNQQAKATALYQRCMEIYEATLGKSHPETIHTLSDMAWNAASDKQWDTATLAVQEAQQRSAAYLSAFLPTLSEKEQLDYLRARVEFNFFHALSLGWSAPEKTSAAAAEWLINGRAMAFQSLADQQVLARDAADPTAKQLVETLRDTRNRLAAHVNGLPAPGREQEYQQKVKTLYQEEALLAQQLARAVGRPLRANAWVKLDDVRAKLADNTALVDIARFRLYDFRADKKAGERYVAWITPSRGKGDVQVVDLGPADEVDALVQKCRDALLNSARKVTEVGEAKALESARKPLEELSAKALHPLLPVLSKYDDWIVCPDGALWLTPWNALLLPDGMFAIEKHQIRHVVAGRDLVQEGSKRSGPTALVFADPDYDLSPGQVAATSGVRRSATPLLGRRLQGTIGSWNVSFEFGDKEVVIYDEDEGGSVAGQGSWKQDGGALTIQTGLSRFEGALAGGEIRGQRSKRNDDGSASREAFRIVVSPNDTRSLNSAFKTLPKVPRLPGTAIEAESIRPHLHKWLGREPTVYLEQKASETTLKSAESPRLLVLATHGYFLSQPPTPEDKGKAQHGIDNPLLRCGLMLAGCNKRAEAKPGEDDGILTGLEIVGMDLRGTELVVLSACETGLGDVRSGEGVAGLRQGFQLAGAKGVLASLWQVPDRETALLMNAFYGELTKGKSQAAALREAQLSRMAARRATFGAAHPFFWGAFTLTGLGTE